MQINSSVISVIAGARGTYLYSRLAYAVALISEASSN
jgi:hypothetical protein